MLSFELRGTGSHSRRDDNGLMWIPTEPVAVPGTGDRWADIAVAAMSTEWNYGPGWEDTLIRA